LAPISSERSPDLILKKAKATGRPIISN